jgi:hypothetical protein
VRRSMPNRRAIAFFGTPSSCKARMLRNVLIEITLVPSPESDLAIQPTGNQEQHGLADRQGVNPAVAVLPIARPEQRPRALLRSGRPPAEGGGHVS